MTSLFPPFTRRASFRKQPFFYEAGRGVYYKSSTSALALNLDFTTGTLDPRITFSRGTNATLTDSTGKITYAPANLLLQSQALATSPWVVSATGAALAPTATNNYAAAPDGTNTATRVQLSLNGGTATGDISYLYQSATFTSGSSLFSFYAKSTDGNTYVCQIISPNSVGSNITITNTWQRFYSSVATAGGSTYYAVRLRGGQIPANSNTADILVWGAQLEPVTYQTTPSTYVATTSSAYYGPRFDYDPNTLQCKGLLIEEQRTNLTQYSQDFTNAWWTSTNLTITAAAGTSPSGTNTANSVVPTAVSGRHYFTRNINSATTNTVSWYIKPTGSYTKVAWFEEQNTGNYATFNLSGAGSVITTSGATATITAINNGWYRITATAVSPGATGFSLWFIPQTYTSGSPTGNWTPNGTDGFLVWGAQFEVGAFATSYIPTTSATATRNADVASMTGSNFSSWYNQSAGTFVTQSDTANPSTQSTTYAANDGTANNRIMTYYINAFVNIVTTSGSTQSLLIPTGFAVNTFAKLAAAYQQDNFAMSANGGAVSTDTSGTVPTVNRLGIGNENSNAYLNGHIASIQYYNKRLTNATLQSLTT